MSQMLVPEPVIRPLCRRSEGRRPRVIVTRRLDPQIAGVLWTCSIFPLFAPTRVRGAVLPPARCGNGNELTPDNLVPAERGYPLALPSMRGRSCRCLASQTDGRDLMLK
jgi:hypothetical protein